MRYKVLYCLTLVFGVLLFNGCEEYEDTEVVSPAVSSSNQGVRFSSANPGSFTIRYDALGLSVEVVRDDTSGELSVPIKATGTYGEHFVFPDPVVFPAGEDTVIVNFAAKESAPQDSTMSLFLAMDEDYSNVYSKGIPYFDSRVYIIPPCAGVELSIDIFFDGYGSETTWEIVDEDDEVVASGGPYVDGQETATSVLCMELGTYTFTVFDVYGDGLSYPNEGSVVLSVGGETIFETVGDFGPSASTTFTLEQYKFLINLKAVQLYTAFFHSVKVSY